MTDIYRDVKHFTIQCKLTFLLFLACALPVTDSEVNYGFRLRTAQSVN